MSKHCITSVMIVLFIIFFADPAFSQSSPLKVGVRGGLNWAKTSEKEGLVEVPIEGVIDLQADVNINYRMALGFGAFVEYWVNPLFAIQCNALYSQKGEKGRVTFNASYFEPEIQETVFLSGDFDATLKLVYFSFPLLGKLAFGKEGGLRPYLLAGPEIGFLSSAKSNLSGDATLSVPALGITQTQPVSQSEEDVKDQFESVEFALDFGGGLAFPLGNATAFIDARYDLGLSKINKEGSEDIKNRVIYLNLGLTF